MESNIARFIQVRKPEAFSEDKIIDLVDVKYIGDEVKKILESGDRKMLQEWCEEHAKLGSTIKSVRDLPVTLQEVVKRFSESIGDSEQSVNDLVFWDDNFDQRDLEKTIQQIVATLICARLGNAQANRPELEKALIYLIASLEPRSYKGPYYLRYPSYGGKHKVIDSSSKAGDSEPVDPNVAIINQFNDLQSAIDEINALVESRRHAALGLQTEIAEQVEQLRKPKNVALRAEELVEQVRLNQPDLEEEKLKMISQQMAKRETEEKVQELDGVAGQSDLEYLEAGALSEKTNELISSYNLSSSDNLFALQSRLTRKAVTLAKNAGSYNLTWPNFWGPLIPMMPISPIAPLSMKPDVHVMGIGDLKVLKEHVIRYEAKDISHIENVLAGEYKERKHERRKLTEFVVDEITELEERSLNELETSERHELQSATSFQLQAEFSNETWASAGGSYGPIANFEAGTALNLGASTNTSSSSNQQFGREVVTRAVEEITKRTSKRIRSTVINEVAETNTHGFDNAATDSQNIAGIYQYLQKIVCIKQYNYGSRLLLLVTVPRPAVNLINFRMADQERRLDELEDPPEFNVHLETLSEYNYEIYVNRFKAIGVEPPPPFYSTVTTTFKFDDTNILGEGSLKDMGEHIADFLYSQYQRGARWVENGTLDIPDGYEVLNVKTNIIHPENIDETDFDFGQDVWGAIENTFTGNFVVNKYYPASSVVNFNVGQDRERRIYNLNGNNSARDQSTTTFGSGWTGAVPYGFSAWSISPGISITLSMKCKRTELALDNWKLDTYEKLYSGYVSLLSVYQEKLAALDIQSTLPSTENPSLNRVRERREIKTVVIDAILAEAGVTLSPQNYSKFVRFFELAIEWENINYKFISEQYGANELKLRKLNLLSDNDSQHNDFLRAHGAMTIVPVRMEYLQYMLTLLREGTIDGYVDHNDDIAFVMDLINGVDSQENESLDGPPFEVEIPTSLVYLKANGELPVLGEC